MTQNEMLFDLTTAPPTALTKPSDSSLTWLRLNKLSIILNAFLPKVRLICSVDEHKKV